MGAQSGRPVRPWAEGGARAVRRARPRRHGRAGHRAAEGDRRARLRARHVAAPPTPGSRHGRADRARARTGRGLARMRGPVDRLFPNLSHRQRVLLDWVLTIVFAVLIVLAVKGWVVNPYRIPSPSMEPALHCARPEPGCEADRSDRVLANRFIYHFRDPRRGEIVVFHAPKAANEACTGGIFVKRIIGLPGEVWAERSGYTYIDGKRLAEPYVRPSRRDSQT